MRVGFEIATAVAFVVSLFTMSGAALPIALILVCLFFWPDDRPKRDDRPKPDERDRMEARVDAALEALRGLGRDYPRSH